MMVGKTWKTNMKPNEFTSFTNPPKKKSKKPPRVKPNISYKNTWLWRLNNLAKSRNTQYKKCENEL